MAISITCNPVKHQCGCSTWDELESGVWVRKHWPCNRHSLRPWPHGCAGAPAQRRLRQDV